MSLTNIEVADREIVVEVEDELAGIFVAFGFTARPSRRSDGVVVSVLPQHAKPYDDHQPDRDFARRDDWDDFASLLAWRAGTKVSRNSAHVARDTN